MQGDSYCSITLCNLEQLLPADTCYAEKSLYIHKDKSNNILLLHASRPTNLWTALYKNMRDRNKVLSIFELKRMIPKDRNLQ